MFDVAIIGTGPAGLSGAINLKIRGKDIIWFGSNEMSQKVEKSEKIANYPGPGLISGSELNERFKGQAAELGLAITDRMVTTISKLKERYMLLADNEIFEAKALLLATGVANTKGFPGEEKLLGRGVSYCATCDGMFYKGKTIAVFCQDRRFEEEVEYLAEIAEKVYLFAAYPDCGISLPNVELVDSKIRSLEGEDRLTGLVLADQPGAGDQPGAADRPGAAGRIDLAAGDVAAGDRSAADNRSVAENVAAGDRSMADDRSVAENVAAGNLLAVDGLFCLRNAIAPATLIPGLVTDGPHIVVDRNMATSFPGCYAAGDCTGTPYQIAKAVGEGNVAAHSILKYLEEA